jgi:Family of unknown function (DUF5681)
MSGPEQETDTIEPIFSEPNVGSERARKVEYEVGYGRPPAHTRFKPGKSGNPNGGRAGRPNPKTTIARVINEMIQVREGQKTRKMTKLAAMVQAHTMKAVKGDARSAGIVLGFAKQLGLLTDTESETRAEVLPEEDAAILKDFLRRNAGSDNCDPADDGKDG